MTDSKKKAQKALSTAYPSTDEGLAQLMHAQLYFKYSNLYIYYMRKTFNKLLPVPDDLQKPQGPEYDTVDDLIQTLVRHTNRNVGKAETSTYHAKVLRMEDAEQLFTLKEDLNLSDLPKAVIPYERARDAIIQSPQHLVVIDCPCRVARGDKGCYPRDVCIIVGEPWVSWMLENNTAAHPRRITQEEALEITRRQHEAGNVHSAFFKDAAANRLFALCNCCSCCCCAVLSKNILNAPMFAPTGWCPEVDETVCVGCGQCADDCNFKALRMEDGKVMLQKETCMGCETCVGKCPVGAITMRLDSSGENRPLDFAALQVEREDGA